MDACLTVTIGSDCEEVDFSSRPIIFRTVFADYSQMTMSVLSLNFSISPDF